MTIYELYIDSLDATKLFFPVQAEWDKFVRIVDEKITNGISAADEWDEFIVLQKEPQKSVDFYDIEDFGLCILNQKSYDLISSLLNDTIEVLKLKSDVEDFYLLNVIEETNCFNKEESDVDFLNSGVVMEYRVLSFIPQKIRCPIFRIPELPYTVFVTDEILQIYLVHQLTGLSIDLKENIWEGF